MSEGEREPCPYRVFEDMGGGFLLGAVGGAVWHSVKGYRNAPRGARWSGAFTAARLAKDQGVPISTIAFGTQNGEIQLDGKRIAVPVATDQMKTIAKLSGGQSYTAATLKDLEKSYDEIQNEIGYRTVPGPGGAGWLRLGVITTLLAAGLALLINRRLPT